MKFLPALLASTFLLSSSSLAQEADKNTDNKQAAKEEKWDVQAPPLPTRKVSIDVDEGTWMNVDLSPDGQTIAFDLLGDIYTMPISGGTPTRISEGLAFDMQPQFSPDGSMIAFTSDRNGGDNIWIMDSDGSNKRQITKEKFRLLNAPTWSPSGQYIAAKKHFTTSRSLGTGEIWLYHLGGGDGIQLVKKPNDRFQKELGEPTFSVDGKSIYFTRNTTPGDTFIYAQDTNQEVFAIERYDMATGEKETVIDGAGGAVRPTPSPDGKHIAFVRRERGQSKLYVKTLASGIVKKVYDDLDQDMQGTWAVHGVYPTMDWTPNSREIVFWAGGKIKRVDLDGNARDIPFRIADDRDVIDAPRPQIDVAPDRFATQMPRYATVSPNGQRVVFESLGKLYVKSLPNGQPKRLTRSGGTSREAFPSWSRDGRRVVYVSWDDETLGVIRTTSASGGTGRAITKSPGHYRRPTFSPDGKTVVFEKGSGGFLLSEKWSEGTGIYRMSSGGGAMERISKSGSNPHFGKNSDRVYFTTRDGGKSALVSSNLNGGEKNTHATADLVTEFEVSPEGDFLAFRENYAAYVMPMTPGPQSLGAGKSAKSVPVTKASSGGASFINWAGSNRLSWSLGPQLYTATTDALIPTMPKADGDERKYAAPTEGASLSMEITADKPSGTTAITNARLITMRDNDGGVIENGTIVIDGNRIVAVGASDAITVPAGARLVDGTGKTVTPGFIDAHAHGPQGDGGITPEQNWSAIAHLALGVTTVHDPSNRAEHVFPAAEMQRAGSYLAPRIYSTAEVVYGAKAPGFFADISDYDDALAHVRRLKSQGAHSIKNYNQPRREQRQQVVKAAIAENMAVVAEGGSLFTMDMTLIADGNTTLEHNIPQAKLYEDVLSFYSQTNVGYTPTLVVTYGGLAGDPYWRYATNVWEHPILSKHVPPHILQPNSVRRTKAPETDFVDDVAAAGAKALSDRGVMVSIGAHGQQQGLAAHWEMWSFARGGMSPLEALQTATSTPAKALGFDKDIGTLEKGKLADLVIMTENPLDDIRNTDKIDHVMLNGRLYEAASMNEVITGSKVRAPYYWE